jgi:hypothetical protein
MYHVFPRLAVFLTSLGLLSVLSVPLRAEIVEDIYTARLPVESRDPGALRSARREGLAQVLVKASGDALAATRPETAAALDAPERYLLSYSYEDAGDAGMRLRLEYDERAVQALLRSAGLPLWTANRPPTLAWVVVSAQGRRQFLSPAERPEEGAVLAQSFALRGLPLQLPLLDLADTTALTPGEAWRQSSPAIIDASRRYRGAEILAGRAALTATGRWVGDWRLLYEGRWLARAVDAQTFGEFSAAGADLVASTVAGRYAVLTDGEADRRYQVTLRGIRGYDDYLLAQEILAGLETVRRVVPERLLGDQVSLRLEADADLAQLAQIIELDRRFVATASASGEAGLFYEWIP